MRTDNIFWSFFTESVKNGVSHPPPCCLSAEKTVSIQLNLTVFCDIPGYPGWKSTKLTSNSLDPLLCSSKSCVEVCAEPNFFSDIVWSWVIWNRLRHFLVWCRAAEQPVTCSCSSVYWHNMFIKGSAADLLWTHTVFVVGDLTREVSTFISYRTNLYSVLLLEWV